MKKVFLIKNPEVFQGDKFLKSNKNYFEGWYFKITNNKDSIAFIPGISINKKDKKAFIQIITNDNSYFIEYNISDFKFNHEPFYIKVGDNYFSKDSIHIDIKVNKQKLNIWGNVNCFDIKNITTNVFNPNIMGIFAYIPFMECNHAILSMKNSVNGLIRINKKKLKFDEGIGYIEKDWGSSFPKSYIWIQGNNFKNNKVSFMLSIADIPFKVFNFRGVICSLIIDDTEYRFATYNGAKIIKYDITDNLVSILLQKGTYYLEVKTKYMDGLRLGAPVKGKMSKDILESISSIINVTLKNKDRILFKDTSVNCGLEIVNK